MSWTRIVAKEHDDLWDLAIRCDALYECPKHPVTKKRIGPLVPYAGKDGQGRNLFGDVYFNFAKIEDQMDVVEMFAMALYKAYFNHPNMPAPSTIVGIPEGGRTLGQELARTMKKRFVYPTKVLKPSASNAKEEYGFEFKRLELSPEDTVLICDDVHNNFQNTGAVIDAITGTGAHVVGLCSALNRSPNIDKEYIKDNGDFTSQLIPVITAIRRPLLEYNQDDPEVVEDVVAGRIEWKVKPNWASLKEAMLMGRGPQV